jgi:hypothetical protein
MKNGPAPRTNVAPVSDVTDRDGWTIKAGTVGKLSYTGGSRGWCFIYAFAGTDYAHDVLKADLFRFVSVSEFANALTGTDLTTDEAGKVVAGLDSARAILRAAGVEVAK